MSSSDLGELLTLWRKIRQQETDYAARLEAEQGPCWNIRCELARYFAACAEARIGALEEAQAETARREQSARDANLLGRRGLC